MNKFSHFVFFSCVMIATLLPCVARGFTDVLDQEYINSSMTSFGFLGTWEPAQVFTVSMAGQLSRIEVLVNRRSSDRDPLIMHIYDTLNSAPNNLLATYSLSYSQVLAAR